MSYVLRIYTIYKQEFIGLKERLNIVTNEDGFTLPLKNHQIVITKETPVEYEDIPPLISEEFPGIEYLIECNLEPRPNNKKYIKEMIKIAKIIATEGVGVIENPQTDEVIIPSGVKRALQNEKTKRFSVIQLSWWFNDDSFLENNLKLVLETIERDLPEALPRRYDIHDPPQETFKDITSFHDFLIKNLNDRILWHPSKPVDYVHLGIPEFIGPMRIGYRFGNFSITIDAAVLDMPGWSTKIERLFKNISHVINPFYGDIYVLGNYIRSHSILYSDSETEQHPISSVWWNGIPRKLGIGLVIGEPILNYVKIKNPTFVLDNGSEILLNEHFSEILSKDVSIQDGILQVEVKDEQEMGFSYPKLWPFSGPKITE